MRCLDKELYPDFYFSVYYSLRFNFRNKLFIGQEKKSNKSRKAINLYSEKSIYIFLAIAKFFCCKWSSQLSQYSLSFCYIVPNPSSIVLSLPSANTRSYTLQLNTSDIVVCY